MADIFFALGTIHLSTYLKTFKVGDIVDIKVGLFILHVSILTQQPQKRQSVSKIIWHLICHLRVSFWWILKQSEDLIFSILFCLFVVYCEKQNNVLKCFVDIYLFNWLKTTIHALYLSVNVLSTKEPIENTIFTSPTGYKTTFLCTVQSSEPHKDLAVCRAREVKLYFSVDFKTLSIGLCLGIEPVTFLSAAKCSTNKASAAMGNMIHAYGSDTCRCFSLVLYICLEMYP